MKNHVWTTNPLPLGDYFPAFPIHSEGSTGEKIECLGMSLRDYFAAKALAGMLASDRRFSASDSRDREAGAVQCYAIADAMLKERAKP